MKQWLCFILSFLQVLVAWGGNQPTSQPKPARAAGVFCPECLAGASPSVDMMYTFRGMKRPENKPPVCEWSQIPINFENPYAVCGPQKKNFQTQIRNCLSFQNSLTKDADLLTELRRQQMKLIFSEDLAYLTRFQPRSPYYEKVWESFRNRWRTRIGQDPEVFRLDQNLRLKEETCMLSKMMGLACGSNTEQQDIFKVYKDRARKGAENEAAGRIIPEGLAYDLIKANLISKSQYTPTEPLIRNGDAESREAQLREVEVDRRISKDIVMGFWPELRLMDSLREKIRAAMLERNLEKRVQNEVAKIETTGAAALYTERANVVENMMKEEFQKRPLKPGYLALIEKMFFEAHQILLKNLDDHITWGRTDPDWLLDQDYLLAIQMKQSYQEKRFDESAKIQTQICSNAFWANDKQRYKMIGLTSVAVVALLTGVGAMAGLGGAAVAAVLGETSGALVLGSSLFDIYDLRQAENAKRRLLTIHGVKDSDVAYAHNETMSAVPMAAVNAALIVPGSVVKSVMMAQKYARLEKDVEKAHTLEKVSKRINQVTTVGNIGMAGYMGKSGVETAVSLVTDTPEVRLKKEQEAKERAEKREAIRRARSDEE